MTERQALVALCTYIPFGPARVKLLVDYFDSAKKVWSASRKELIKVGIKPDRASDFLIHRQEFEKSNYFNKLKKLKIDFITINDANYPANLVDLENAPSVLYIKGSIKTKDTNAIAIVGTRKMTSYGREVAEKFASEIANLGVTIVSGLARGIDTVAHKSAIAVGGRTIAVIGRGLDEVYPLENTKLAEKIAGGYGAVISEYPLGYPALRTNFASRNRIISGLSKAVLVVEGAKKSGTLLTASAAAEQGRQVFAIPGQITSPMSAAPHFLIQNGVKIAFTVKDIIDELDLQLKVDSEVINKILPSSKEEEKILVFLENEPLHLDELARISGFDVKEVSARLTFMEIKGIVKNLGGGIYKKT